MESRYQQFQKACEQYVAQIQQHQKVIGIIVSGSFIHGRLDQHSDIDVYVIQDSDCDYRERGNTWINGVEIEYFMNPPQQIRAYFRKEESPHTAHMLAFGKLVYKKSKEVDLLIAEAKAIMDRRPPAMKNFQIELAKYQLDDWFKDLEDSRLNGNDLAVVLLKNQILEAGINIFCKMHRIRRTKHKSLAVQLTAIDPSFVHIVEETARVDWRDQAALSPLISYLTKLLGGERSREWKLRSALDL